MNNEEIKNYSGFIGLVKPGVDDVEFVDVSYDTSEEGLEKFFCKLVDLISEPTEDKQGKIANAGYLPSPFNEFTMFMNQDQFDPDIKYNVGFFGTPIFGNMAFMLVDLKSKDGTLMPITEDKKKTLNDAMSHFKKFEKDSGIYDAMCNTDKNKFLEEYIKEQNNILNESTKDIKGENYDELQAAKKELEETVNE